MSVGRICIREVDLAELDEPVQAAAQRMHARNVGTLVVQNEAGEPVGILTDRDLALRIVGEGRSPYETRVAQVMTKQLRIIQEDTPIEMAIADMRSATVRRLIVVDARGKLVGLVSMDDILELLSDELSQLGELVQRESPAALART